MRYRGTIAYRAGLGGNVPEGFLASVVPAWDLLVNHASEYENLDGTPIRFHFMRGLSCMLHDSANQIAEGFLGDWVLFLDTDHVFKSDAFYEMVTAFEENNLDILTGFAQKRQPPYLPLIMKTTFDPLSSFTPIIPNPIEKNILIPVDAAGLACVMVRRNVFEKIKQSMDEKPFDFRNKFNPPVFFSTILNVYGGGGSDMSNRYVKIPEDRRWDEFYWEDVSFYWRAKLLGFQAWCAPWIKFHHIETRLVTDDMMQLPTADFPIPQ